MLNNKIKKERKPFRKFAYRGTQEVIINRFHFYKNQMNLYNMPKKVRRIMLDQFVYFRSRLANKYYSEVFDTWQLMAVGYGLVSDSCLETMRRQLRQKFGKLILVKTNVVANVSVYAKANHSRMGKGKGAKFVKKVVFIRPGRILLEVRGLRSKMDLYLFAKKLNFGVKWVCVNKV